MAARPDLRLLKETRISLESRHQDSAITANVAPQGLFQRRPKRKDSSLALDERAFAAKHIASASGTFSRKASFQPKSFLWRITDAGKTLSIQCIDLTRHSHETKDPYVQLQLGFNHAVRPGCVVFADQADPSSSTFRCFVVTEHNELYTITLKTEYFTRSTSAAEYNPQKWSKVFSPSCFSGRHPVKLIALDDLDLLCSREDGSLLRLSRPKDSDGKQSGQDIVLS